jgi:predicted metalloprotease
MSRLSFRGAVGAAMLAVVGWVAPAATASAASRDPAKDPVRVSAADVDASNQKIASAYSALVAMWSKELSRVGERFAAPRIARYENTVMTACGIIRTNNAEYCPEANTIYFDDVFVAGMAKRAAMALGTDGDMAGIGIIAHEMGHAVALQLGHESRSSYDNESTADCLAGAFAKQASLDGSLEKGDVEEAFFGMSLSGDPTPEPTGNVRYDAMVQRRIARQSHGTKEQRTENFRSGLTGGPRVCLAELRS